MKALRTPRQINGSQRVGGGHVWPHLLDSPNGKLGLAQVILTGRLGVFKSLPDDILKVRVHGGMRAHLAAGRQPFRNEFRPRYIQF